MFNVVLATKNQGKVREVKEVLGADAHVITMADAGLGDLEIDETGTTFEENSFIKASAVMEALPEDFPCHLVMADDSGLEIDYFDRAPGIYSSRWLGEDTPYEQKNAIVLERLKDVPDEDRTARYVCSVVALLKRDGAEPLQIIATETAEGMIAHEPAGHGGFGYDPIFYFPEYGKTFAELTPDEKNAVSHRGKALREVEAALRNEGALPGELL